MKTIKKRVFAISTILVLCVVFIALAAESRATPSMHGVRVNGELVDARAFVIGGRNYFMLRDVAYILRDTPAHFDAVWDDGRILLTSGRVYDGELSQIDPATTAAVRTGTPVYVNGEPMTFTAYSIRGNNFFQLRELGDALGFSVEWHDNEVLICTWRGEPQIFTIATWLHDECSCTADPQTAAARARWDDRRLMEARHNFKIRYERYGGWHDVRDDMRDQMLVQNRNWQMWMIDPSWFPWLQGQRLFSPIPMHHFEACDIRWNQCTLTNTSRGGVPHGFSHGAEMSGGVYFNMRLLEETGLPRDIPFTLQQEDNWTWDTFTDISRPLSRDLLGSHWPMWPITSFNVDFLNQALASNGAAYVTINPETGHFENATTTDEFRETLEWVAQLYRERLVFAPGEHEPWDAFVSMFNDSQGALRVAGHYAAISIYPELDDPWGFVSFPRGPRSDRHYAWVSRTINVIPFFYTEDEVDAFMFAYRMWNRPLPADTPQIRHWAEYHRDMRSVEETMANFTNNPDLQIMPAHLMMPGLGHTVSELFAWRIWSGDDPAVIIEEAQPVWNAFIERVNNLN
ncbi:MAG: hypothetical protein FWC70_08445 [Defluviitaleaceae bacterium]|nr:hypothetical protein [Defluviitaleaceae bacterium]